MSNSSESPTTAKPPIPTATQPPATAKLPSAAAATGPLSRNQKGKGKSIPAAAQPSATAKLPFSAAATGPLSRNQKGNGKSIPAAAQPSATAKLPSASASAATGPLSRNQKGNGKSIPAAAKLPSAAAATGPLSRSEKGKSIGKSIPAATQPPATAKPPSAATKSHGKGKRASQKILIGESSAAGSPAAALLPGPPRRKAIQRGRSKALIIAGAPTAESSAIVSTEAREVRATRRNTSSFRATLVKAVHNPENFMKKKRKVIIEHRGGLDVQTTLLGQKLTELIHEVSPDVSTVVHYINTPEKVNVLSVTEGSKEYYEEETADEPEYLKMDERQLRRLAYRIKSA